MSISTVETWHDLHNPKLRPISKSLTSSFQSRLGQSSTARYDGKFEITPHQVSPRFFNLFEFHWVSLMTEQLFQNFLPLISHLFSFYITLRSEHRRTFWIEHMQVSLKGKQRCFSKLRKLKLIGL